MRSWSILIVLCNTASSSTADEWWRTASLYQIYPRSFKDSDGDGVGDLKGIEQQAAYLSEIGVDAVWLSPIQTSPMADFGYDISNFTDIDPLLGTMDDFKSLTHTLGKMGIKVLLDFVPNHTSDEHPWFKMSVNRTEPYTDYYVWTDGVVDPTTGNHTPPNNWLSVSGGSAWEWSDVRQQFYLHQFIKQQPDLNYRNPNVVQDMTDVIKYWMNLGVDGLRVDAVKLIYETKNLSLNEPPIPGTTINTYYGLMHIYTANQIETFQLLEQWGQLLYNYSVGSGGKPRVMFLESYTDLNTTMKYYGKENTSLMMPFNFRLLLEGGITARAVTYKELVDEWMTYMPAGSVPNWVVGNHDKSRVASTCGSEMVDAINMLTFILPGIKITYDGEEIGMEDTFIRWDQTMDPRGLLLGPDHYRERSRDPERTPLQWDGSLSSGFSTNSSTWLPVNPNYWWLNVEAQRSAQSSHLKVFQAMGKVKKDPVLKYGNLTTLTPNNDTLIVIRSYNGSHFVLIINMASSEFLFNSRSVFALQHLDMDMTVVVASVNVESHRVGDIFHDGWIRLPMRPKSAILLKSSPSSSPSFTTSLSFAYLLLVVSLFLGYIR